jgi:predicted glycosyltransferase
VGENERLVLVTPGGGEDGAALLTSYLDALALIPAAERPHTLMICGPELAADRRAAIEQAARRFERITVRAFTDEMAALMRAADVVTCMGGYNTVCEVLTHHKRAIVVPRVAPVQEQWIRAHRLAARGLLRAIHPRALTPALLAQTLREELDACALSPAPLAAPLDMDGLPNVARAIDRLLGRERIESLPAFMAHSTSRAPTWQAMQSASW